MIPKSKFGKNFVFFFQMKMAIRKMTKKDATTRLKAVQEFSEMCEDGIVVDVDDDQSASKEDVTKTAVKAVLPFW